MYEIALSAMSAKKEMAELTLMIRVNPNFFFKKAG